VFALALRFSLLTEPNDQAIEAFPREPRGQAIDDPRYRQPSVPAGTDLLI
jgi:hypothetical protein